MFRPPRILALAAMANLSAAVPSLLTARFASDSNTQPTLIGAGGVSSETSPPTSLAIIPPLSLDASGIPISGVLPTTSADSPSSAPPASGSACGEKETVTVLVMLTEILTVTAPPAASGSLTATNSTRTSTVTVQSMSTATVTVPTSSKPPAPSGASESSDLSSLTAQGSSSGTGSPSTGPANIGLGDNYTLYTGDGSSESGWPGEDKWLPFDTMWANNKDTIATSCAAHNDWGNPADPSPEEIKHIHDAILAVAEEEEVPPQFMLATIMQESKGCVRVPITNYGVDNPGLMQDYNGTFTCNTGRIENGTFVPGKATTPCPEETIRGMIREGTKGAFKEANSLIYALAVAVEGLTETANKKVSDGGLDASRFYRAARVYNSGSIDGSGDLGKGIATRCYASDIANRLTGWVKAETKCRLDDKPEE